MIVGHTGGGVLMAADAAGRLRLPLVPAIDDPGHVLAHWLESSGASADSAFFAAIGQVRRDSSVLLETWLICSATLTSSALALRTDEVAPDWEALDPIDRVVLERLQDWRIIPRLRHLLLMPNEGLP